MVSLTMLALSYTHSRVSTLEGTSPRRISTNEKNDIYETNNNYNHHNGNNIPEEYNSNHNIHNHNHPPQPTLYQPEDSLRKRREATNQINQSNQFKTQNSNQIRESKLRNNSTLMNERNEIQGRNVKLQSERRY